MKAQILTAFGGAGNFELTEVPTPEPKPGQVLVRTAAIGINSLEWKIRNGWLERMFPTPLPAILGKEFAGTVVTEAPGLAIGDQVVGFADSGVYAEYAVARAEALALVPDGLSAEQAATLPVAVETAERCIRELGIQPSWTVVVNGAAGAVGSAAVQLLVRQGVTVIGTASERNHPYLTELGATPVAYGPGAKERIQAHGPIDAVFDVTGHDFAQTAIELTTDPKRVLTIADFPAAKLGIRTSTATGTQTANSFTPALNWAATGEFHTQIDQIFPFEQLANAHTHSEQGHLQGKIVVQGPK